MYLKTLRIKKFRSINEMEISFNKGLNIIIGENNSGKTAIIDALRICLSAGKQWRDIGIRNDEDFYIDTTNIDSQFAPIEFDLYFEIENDEDREYFNSMLWQDPLDASRQEIQLHFRYTLETTQAGIKKMRWTSWGGAMEGQSIDPNEAQLIYYTYLAPLRNAEQELRPYAKDNKISSLFRDLTTYTFTAEDGSESEKKLNEEEKIALAAKLEAVITADDWSGLIKTGTSRINEHLEKADIRSKKSNIHLRLLEYKFDNIVKGIITRKPVFDNTLIPEGEEHKQRFFDVSQNGLGENNLIYASAVLGDLKNRRAEKKEHYYSLLIEEPEAHLHPQRQNTFFNYLNNLQDIGLQIFITSHSPTLTAKSNLNDLIVIQQANVNIPFTIKNSELSEDNKGYLRKFLDVTKSQLFFSNGTILVEGISEALLLPILAQIYNQEFNLDENGIEIVNINGVAFESFARLYNSADQNKRLVSRCSIVTDDDRGYLTPASFINIAEGITKQISIQIFQRLQSDNVVDASNRIINEEEDYNFNHADLNQYAVLINALVNEKRTQRSARANNALALASGNLRSELAVYTFEYELMIASEVNYRIMMCIYSKMHPQTTFLPKNEPIKNRALEFVSKLESNKDKSEFAEKLAMFLEKRISKTNFGVPEYIQRAIRWVIEAT